MKPLTLLTLLFFTFTLSGQVFQKSESAGSITFVNIQSKYDSILAQNKSLYVKTVNLSDSIVKLLAKVKELEPVKPPVVVPPPAPTIKTIFKQDFTNTPLGSYTQTQWKTDWNAPTWSNHANGWGRIIDESGNKVIQIDFPKGVMGLANSGVQWFTKLPAGYDELYLTYRFKMSAGFATRDLRGKIPGISSAKYKGPGIVPPDGFTSLFMFHGTSKVFVYYNYPSMYLDYGDKSVIAGKLYYGTGPDLITGFKYQPGVWYTITQYIKLNDVGKNNGITEAYINGKLVAKKTDYVFRTNPETKINILLFSNFLGGSGTTPLNNEWFQFDDFHVYQKL